jgi:hypothetical protein
MALSSIEDRYLSALTAAQFPDMPADEPVMPVDAAGMDSPNLDGMQLAAGPSRTMSDAGGGMGEMKAYDPTTRERLASFLQSGFEGLGMDRVKARQRAQTLIGGPSSNLPLSLGLADVVPFLGTGLQTEEAARMGQEAVTSAQQGNLGTAALQAGGAVVGMVPGAVGTARAAMAAGRAGERLAERMVPQIMAKGGTLADLMQAMSQGSRSQLTAYHGSPHRIDKFSSEKIGTGEGNQTFGYGLYFAESPDVAKTYMEVNPSVLPAPIRTFKGAELEPGSPEYHAASLLDSMTLPQARKTVAGWIKGADPRMAREAEGWAKTLETLNVAQSKSDFKQLKNKGALYTVDIPDELVAKMLDFDKPLREQSDYIKKVIKDNELDYVPDNLTGGRLLEEMNKAFEPDVVSKHLRNAGILGVRYFDQGSRGTGKGTRNIVVFPGGEDQIKIVKTERKK